MTLTFDSGMKSDFKPKNLHFHAPSEHTVDGHNYDLEIHMVHLYPDGSLGGVVGIFFDRQAGGNYSNFFLEQITKVYQTPNTTSLDSQVFVRSFLNEIDTSAFYSYSGSLTTPPCT